MEKVTILISVISIFISYRAVIISKKLSKVGITNSVIQFAHLKATKCNDLIEEFEKKYLTHDINSTIYLNKEYPYKMIWEVKTSYELLKNAVQQYENEGVQLDFNFILDQFWIQLNYNVCRYCCESIPKSFAHQYEESYYANVRIIQQVFANQIIKHQTIKK